MTLSHEMRRAIARGDLALAQNICDQMRGAQAFRWQRFLNKLAEMKEQNLSLPKTRAQAE